MLYFRILVDFQKCWKDSPEFLHPHPAVPIVNVSCNHGTFVTTKT